MLSLHFLVIKKVVIEENLNTIGKFLNLINNYSSEDKNAIIEIINDTKLITKTNIFSPFLNSYSFNFVSRPYYCLDHLNIHFIHSF
ncbi:hypothetical protein CNEO3_570042 [Clostridium neonatale]|nr:hypothetical protein CNEO3_570042 [Clostridium neonatale]